MDIVSLIQSNLVNFSITPSSTTILGVQAGDVTQIGASQMMIFHHEPTDEIVMQVRNSNGTIRWVRLPGNMGPPAGFLPCIAPERTLDVQTTPSVLQKVLGLRPILGMNYEPSPSDYTTTMPSPPVQYGDTDFSNSDYEGLWGNTLNPGSGTCTLTAVPPPGPRNDIANMKQDLNVNYVRFFNLNQEAFRDHVPFGQYCETNNVAVTWPLDFWVNFTTPANENLVKLLVTSLGVLPATVAWRLGNELNPVAQQASKIATLFKIIVDTEKANSIPPHPISYSAQAGTFPSFPTLIKNAIVALGPTYEQEYEDRWFQMVNVYPSDPSGAPTAELNTMINTTWPDSIFKTQPLLITEYGTACNVSSAIQASAVQAQAQFIKDAAENPAKPLFLGGCLFEYTNELWKNVALNPTCVQDDLGINSFSGTFCTAQQIKSTNPYRVDVLTQKAAYNTYKSVVNPAQLTGPIGATGTTGPVGPTGPTGP